MVDWIACVVNCLLGWPIPWLFVDCSLGLLSDGLVDSLFAWLTDSLVVCLIVRAFVCLLV